MTYVGQRWDRSSLSHLIMARHGAPEGTEPHGFLDFTIRVTPELLEGLLGGVWEAKNGKRSRLEAVYVDADGLLYPEFVEMAEEPSR